MLRRTIPVFFGQQKHKDFEPKSAHFLLVHDAVKAVLPSARVVANISERRPYQAHMQVLFDDPTFDWTRIPRFADQFQKKLETGFVDSDPAFPYRLKLRFFDQAHLTLTLGRDNVTVQDVLDCNDEAQRELYRASLGCDELAFRDSRHHIVQMAASMCILHQKYRMGDDAMYMVPRLFWVAYCDNLYQVDPADFVAPSVLSGEAAKNFYSRRDPLPNPVLPQEDLLLIPSVRAIRHMSSSSVFSTSNAVSGMQRQVNIVDTGIVPTQEEYEEMLIRRGIVEPPAPKKPGLMSRIFGWGAKATDKKEAKGEDDDDDDEATAADKKQNMENVRPVVRASRPVPPGGKVDPSNIPQDAAVSAAMRNDYFDGDQYVGTGIGSMWVEMGRRK